MDVVPEGHYLNDGGAMFGTVPRVLWERQKPPDELNRVSLEMNCLLLRRPGLTLLLECGMGDKLTDRQNEIFRPGAEPRLPASLAAAGVAAVDVDVVLLTHLHFDHCGWATRRADLGPEAVPTFPNARYLVQAEEARVAAAPDPRSAPAYQSADFEPLLRTGQLELLEGDGEVLPGVRVEVAPGHTLGHQVVLIGTGDETLFFISDLAPFPAHLRPNWVAGVDLYPAETLRIKPSYLGRAREGHWKLFFYHEGEHPLGELDGDRYRPIEP
ncbi:MAG: MBL fold metallo-hydrolase [Candidatus Dormibacteria bacterium]